MTKVLTALIVAALCSGEAVAQCLDSQTLDTIVLLEKELDGRHVPHGTGFLYREHPDSCTAVITAKHLLKADEVYVSLRVSEPLRALCHKIGKSTVYCEGREWTLEGDRLRTKYALTDDQGARVWGSHPVEAVDIAAFPLDIHTRITVNKLSLEFARIRVIVPSYVFPSDSLELGQNLYFLGFPAGLGADDPISPLLRSGAVSWVHPNSPLFLVDAVSMGGSSGSPVFTCAARDMQFRAHPSRLTGIVVGHLNETRQLFQLDPESGKVALEETEIENWGLARALGTGAILETLENLNCE